MDVAALVLGIIGVIFGIIPFCNLIAPLISIIGLVLGIVSLVLKSKNNEEKKGMAIAGTALSAIGSLLWILPFLLVSI